MKPNYSVKDAYGIPVYGDYDYPLNPERNYTTLVGAITLFNEGRAKKVSDIGRMALQSMIDYFVELGYKPVHNDTDGFYFEMPETFRYTKENPYIGKGRNSDSVKDKAYTGAQADVAEFNDTFDETTIYHKANNNGII